MNTRANPAGRCRLRTLAVLLAAAWSLGLGDGNDSAGKSIPIPSQNFTVTVTDSQGRALQAERFTWEGKVYFSARLGQATVSLPFAKVSKLTLHPESKAPTPEEIMATVELRSGKTTDVALDRTSKCYGDTEFGPYEIFVKDVREIVFR